MSHDSRRITLISRHQKLRERSWNRRAEATTRVILLDSFAVLRDAMTNSLSKLDADVERVVLDRSSSASDYLALLAEMPRDFNGDVLMIRDDETGFLSAMGRGGDRILYALSAEDVGFYLETHGLVEPGGAVIESQREYPLLQFHRRSAVA